MKGIEKPLSLSVYTRFHLHTDPADPTGKPYRRVEDFVAQQRTRPEVGRRIAGLSFRTRGFSVLLSRLSGISSFPVLCALAWGRVRLCAHRV